MSNEEKQIKIAYLTMRDPKDRRTWSGTYYHMAQALQKHCGEVTYIGPLDASKEKLVGRILNKASQLLLKKNFMYHHSILAARRYAKVASQKLAGQSFDVIIAPAGETAIAFLHTDTPIILLEDATYGLLQNYYPEYSNLLGRSIHEMHVLESRSLKKANVVVSSSEWAAQSAIEFYHTDEQKVHVVPLGANFETPPPHEVIQQRKKSARCKLLFPTVSWQRKGGEIAFETLLKLEEMGIQAELIVCGCIPPANFAHEHMQVIPFLDKNDARQRKELEKLFATVDFLLLPTRSDCTPMVFCEAGAFGLPIITTDTGGVPGIVRDGENGFMLPLSARGTEYAELIAEIYQDDERYAQLVKSSRAAFETRLNWDAWALSMQKIIAELLGRPVVQNFKEQSVATHKFH